MKGDRLPRNRGPRRRTKNTLKGDNLRKKNTLREWEALRYLMEKKVTNLRHHEGPFHRPLLSAHGPRTCGKGEFLQKKAGGEKYLRSKRYNPEVLLRQRVGNFGRRGRNGTGVLTVLKKKRERRGGGVRPGLERVESCLRHKVCLCSRMKWMWKRNFWGLDGEKGKRIC